ncbi:MAG: PKD domain-containing protein, partial [Bacteroidota bacterium]|nr:PKD domain-containing protein [Bacteroidota bacterium]
MLQRTFQFRSVGEGLNNSFIGWSIAIALFSSFAIPASATHILGGSMYYEHIGGSLYRITLELYRDCGPNNSLNIPFDDPVLIGVYDGNGAFQFPHSISFAGEELMPVALPDPCMVLPPELCSSVAYYVSEIELPVNNSGYHISYQRCCRTPGTVNLAIPEDQGFTCTVFIPPSFQQQNNSPRFLTLPPVALCVTRSIQIDMSATDADNDQLTYALWAPYIGASVADPIPLAGPPPYSSVTWAAGYDPDQPVDSDPPLSLDPTTGMIDLSPSSIGSYVFGIRVSEYRAGEFIGYIFRDVHLTVVACDTEIPASISPQTEICTGSMIHPMNESPFGQYWHWDFGDPTTLADTSDLQFPEWSYLAPGLYTVTLITNPGYSCADTSSRIFDVRPPLEITVIAPAAICPFQETVLTVQGAFSSSAITTWTIQEIGELEGAVQMISFGSPGVHSIEVMIDDNGCLGTAVASIVVEEPTEVEVIAPSSACAGEFVAFVCT